MTKLSYETAAEGGKKTIDDLEPGTYAVKDGRYVRVDDAAANAKAAEDKLSSALRALVESMS